MVADRSMLPTDPPDRETMQTIQQTVRERAVFTDSYPGDATVAGVDQAFRDDRIISATVVYDDRGWRERTAACRPQRLPYIPGYLAFREGPPATVALDRLHTDPDVILVDGNGRLHPREAGLATHLGVALDRPAVGVAKSLLCGEPSESIEGLTAGERVAICADGENTASTGTTIGYAVQTRQFDAPTRHINPLFVSPGHRVSAETAADIVVQWCQGLKHPAPLREADAFADRVKQDGRWLCDG